MDKKANKDNVTSGIEEKSAVTLGEKILSARKQQNISQAKLAMLVGANSAKVISNWENNVNLPDIKKLEMLTYALKVPVDYFFDFGNSNCDRFTPEEIKMMSDYRNLDESGKMCVDVMLKLQKDRCDKKQK